MKEMLIVCDFFQCMLKSDWRGYAESYEFNGGRIRFVREKLANANFEKAYSVYVAGSHLATMFTNVRDRSVIPSNCIQWKIENHRLYNKGWIGDMMEVLQYMEWEIRNVQRVDVAIDGGDHLRMWERSDKRKGGDLIRIGTRKGAKFREIYDGDFELETVDVGSTNSDRWLTVYNKTSELKKSNKDYIPQFWEQNGLRDYVEGREVQRLEVKLRNAELLRYESVNEDGEVRPFDWRRLEDAGYLAGMAKEGCRKLWEFVPREHSDDNKSRRPRVSYIDWSAFASGCQEFLKVPAKKSNEVYRVKLSVKTMYWIYLATGKRYYVQIAQEMAEGINSLGWFSEQIERWELQFVKYKGRGVYSYMGSWQVYDNGEQLKLYEVQ